MTRNDNDAVRDAGEPAIVRDLKRPEAHDNPASEAVELHTTHMSWVFIVGDRVYKLRRPVHYPFCDFSTRELRDADCEAEIRVNQPLGGDVYRGIVPVYCGPEGHTTRKQDGGEVVEHAVLMNRLDAHDACDALVSAGRLSLAHLVRLARTLARYYENAPRVPEAGTPARVRELLRENLVEMRDDVPPHILPRAPLAFLEAGTEARLAGATVALERRREGPKGDSPKGDSPKGDSWIREGHGDLRLEHVYFAGGRVTEPRVIDGVEFNRDFRLGDVALDVAFFAMELESAGRADLSAAFLSAFARACNDYSFYPLVDLYLSYRAAVRAKVAALSAAGLGLDSAEGRAKHDEAARLMGQAARHIEGVRPPPAVICVGGTIGAGKSTVAERLVCDLQAPVVSSDHTRKGLAGIAAHEPGQPAMYSDDFSARTLATLIAHAEDVLASGRSVILDATFRNRSWREAARALADRHRAPFFLIEAVASDNTVRARLRTRETMTGEDAPVSDAREHLLDKLRDSAEPPAEIPAESRLTYDTETDDHEGFLQDLRRRMRR